jgi:hypothetical protein
MQSAVTDGRPPAAGPQVEYVLDPGDFLDCAMFLWEKGRQRQLRDAGRGLVGCLVILAVIVGGAALLWRTEHLGPLAFAGVAVAGTLIMILLGVEVVRIFFAAPLHRRLLRRHIEQMRAIGVVKDRRRDRVTFGPEGFTEVNEWRDDDGGVEVVERKETRVYWPAVACIDVAEEHAIFTVTGKGFLYVPKRAFPNEPAFLRFVRAADELWRAFLRGPRAAGPEMPAVPPDERLRLPK